MHQDPKRPVKFSTVANREKEEYARQTRAALFKSCRAAIDQTEDDIAGYVLVVWDDEGNMRSSYDTTRGPIRPPLVPTLASDALNRHVAVMLAVAKAEEGVANYFPFCLA
jgi:hypothetical protein